MLALIGPPYLLSANVTSTTIYLQWKEPFDPHSIIRNYVVSYYLLSTPFSIESPRPETTISDIYNASYLISSLLVSSTYHLKVFTVTKEESNGPESEPVIITTSSPGKTLCTNKVHIILFI